MSTKEILLATRPLAPPWDEASKNFAYFLAKSIQDPELQMHILTTPTVLEGLDDNVVSHPIFPSYDATRAGHSFSQKAILSSYLFTQSHTYDIVHYLFTPTVFNSRLIRFGNWLQSVVLSETKDPCVKDGILRPAQNDIKTIQTIATLREDLYGPSDWKKMFFADKLVVYSEYSKRKLEEASFTNVTRIYPGVDLNLYSPQPKDEATMQHFDIGHEDFVLSYFGEYARLGATDMLVEMLVRHCRSEQSEEPQNIQDSNIKDGVLRYAQDDRTHKNIKFIFACRVKNDADQKKKDEVVAKLTQAGIIDRVRFSDTFKDMPKLYNLTDIVLFPAGDMHGKFDIPLVIIEGYACGKPVIVSDLPIFREFTNQDISAIIPAGDSAALWTTIEDLMRDEAKKTALGKSARAFVEQHFDLRNTAREYERLYQFI
jgi:glycosyltransferase involved in cell wall biosynthesis